MEINVLQILFQVVNFGVVFGAISYLLYKPVMKILDERRNKAEETLMANETALREKEELEALKKKAKVQAERETVKLIETARDEAKALKIKLTRELREEVSDLHKRELLKLEQEKGARVMQIENQIAKLAIAIAAKIIDESVDAKKHKALIAEATKALAKSL